MPHDEKGREIPDPTPVAIPANATKPESMDAMIARLVTQEVSRAAVATGLPSFEEEDDFEDDEAEMLDPSSPYYVEEGDIQLMPAEKAPDGSVAGLEADEGRPADPVAQEALRAQQEALQGDSGPNEPEVPSG